MPTYTHMCTVPIIHIIIRHAPLQCMIVRKRMHMDCIQNCFLFFKADCTCVYDIILICSVCPKAVCLCAVWKCVIREVGFIEWGCDNFGHFVSILAS